MTIIYPIGAFYPSQSGGPSNTVYWICKALNEKGHNTIISTTDTGIFPEHDISKSTWLDTNYGEIIYQKTFYEYIPICAKINTLSKIGQADVIHLTSIFYPLSWLIAIYNKLFLQRPIIWSPRGELDEQALVFSTWKKRPILWLIKKILKKNAVFHSTCPAETAFTKSVLGEDIRIFEIPNYLILPKLVKTNKEKYFLYIGRIHPKKAIENLIYALEKSSAFLKSNFTLKIAGDYYNEYGKRIFKYVEDRQLSDKIIFLGQIEGEEKEITIAKAYFSFMPSHTENFGNVVIEALAQKTPVVASRGTPWKLLNEHKAGFWVANDVSSLVNTISEILQLSDLEYHEISENAYRLVEYFDVGKNIGNWINLYSSLIDAEK